MDQKMRKEEPHFSDNVLSFDGDKVRFISSGADRLVEKITRGIELEQIRLAAEYLAKHPPPLIKNIYTIRIVPVVNWLDERTLVTKFCEGDNCEYLMRDCDTISRRHALELIKEIILAMRQAGFLWGDLCPRNIIVDRESSVIWLLDFERELLLLGKPATELEFSRYFRSYAWEEFSCFLFGEEREEFFSDILVDEVNNDELIGIDTIISRRKKALLAQLFGLRSSYTRREIVLMQTLMADVVRPFKINEIPFFPMEVIDPWTCKFGGAGTYAELVLWLEQKDEGGRHEILDKLSKSI